MREIHGQSRTKVHQCWRDMRYRCQNPNHKWYSHYGAIGISVCPEWESFVQFLADMGQPPSSKHSLDRINPEKGYYPENCRWADITDQARNLSDRYNKYGHRGVSKHRGRFRAYLYVQRRQVFLGCYDTAKEAIAARIAGEKKYWGEGV